MIKHHYGSLCTQCGKCCEKYGHSLQATAADIEQWRRKAPWILDYVDEDLGDLWINPVTRDEVYRCPWIGSAQGKAVCRIYEHRPAVCRNYPVDIEQMRKDDCEIVQFLPRHPTRHA